MVVGKTGTVTAAVLLVVTQPFKHLFLAESVPFLLAGFIFLLKSFRFLRILCGGSAQIESDIALPGGVYFNCLPHLTTQLTETQHPQVL